MVRSYLKGKSCWFLKLLVPALVIFSPLANAVWEYNAPPLGAVTDFALAPNTMRVLATATDPNRGIWTSENSGGSWGRPDNTQSFHGAAVKTDSFNNTLAGVSGGVIEVSSDIAGPWSASSGSAINSSWIIEFSLSEFNTVYAAGYTSGTNTGILQISTDAGDNWSPSAIGGDANPPTFSLAIAPTDANTVYVGAQPAVADNGLYKTTNGAVSWNYLSALNFPQVDAVAIDPVDLDYVYAGTASKGLIQRSSDGGASWVILHDPSNGGVIGFTSVRGLAINPADRRIIYAVGGSGSTKVIVSTDCGASWSNVDATGLISGLPTKVVIDPINGLVMVRTDAGAMYQEVLLTTATGNCSADTGLPSSRGGSGSFDWLLLSMLMLIGVVRYRTSPISA